MRQSRLGVRGEGCSNTWVVPPNFFYGFFLSGDQHDFSVLTGGH